MDVQAIAKFVRLSPRKSRDLARAIQGRSVSKALELTEKSERKAAFQLRKVLKSAMANAENNAGLSAEDLIVKEAVVNQGPVFNRWRCGARGMAKPIQKKTSHIKIILSDGVMKG